MGEVMQGRGGGIEDGDGAGVLVCGKRCIVLLDPFPGHHGVDLSKLFLRIFLISVA